MSFLGLIFLIAAHYFAGSGLLRMFGVKMNTPKQVAVSLITGVVILSLVPVALQLAYIPITFASVLSAIIVTCLLMNIKALFNLRNISLKGIKFSLNPRFKVYEWPFMILFSIMMLSSVWRAYYFPPYARDMLSGPEPIAEYTVKEHTMINSVFTINLETTNNHHKPPFVAGLQIIYKLFGFPFGQVWLSIIALSFCVFIYHLLKEKVHPVIACTLLLCFFAIPELYAYTYIILFDYSNMVLFFLGYYFLLQYFNSSDKRQFYFAALLFGFATIIRLETLILIGLAVPAFWLNAYKKKLELKSAALQTVAMMAIPGLFYFMWINVFLKYYMPAQFTLGGQVNPHLSDLTPLFTRFSDIHSKLLFGKIGANLYGYFVPMFIVLTIAEMIIIRKLSRESLVWLYAVAIVYFGLPLIGYLLPLADLMNTTKRGLFKLFPFMLLVLANNGLLKRLSDAITGWEFARVTDTKPNKPIAQRPVAQRSAPQRPAAQKSGGKKRTSR